MKIVALIQARLGSTRLPNKVVLNVEGQSMLQRVVFRARLVPGLDEVYVIASGLDANALRWGLDIPVLRYAGDPNDVLGRYDWAAREVDADVIVRLTADTPCLDPDLSGDVLKAWLRHGDAFLAHNIAPNTDGFDTQVFSARLLRLAHLEATDPYDREHVCPWIERHAWCVTTPVDGECPKLSVDTEEDLERVRLVYRTVGKSIFSRQEALDALRQISSVA